MSGGHRWLSEVPKDHAGYSDEELGRKQVSEPTWVKNQSEMRTTLTISVSDRMQHALPPNLMMQEVGREIVRRAAAAFLTEHQDEILAMLNVKEIAESVEAAVKAELALRMLGMDKP